MNDDTPSNTQEIEAAVQQYRTTERRKKVRSRLAIVLEATLIVIIIFEVALFVSRWFLN